MTVCVNIICPKYHTNIIRYVQEKVNRFLYTIKLFVLWFSFGRSLFEIFLLKWTNAHSINRLFLFVQECYVQNIYCGVYISSVVRSAMVSSSFALHQYYSVKHFHFERKIKKCRVQSTLYLQNEKSHRNG